MAARAMAIPGLDPYGELFSRLVMPEDLEQLRSLRRQLVWAFSWAVPSREAIAALAELSPLIEIGAGTGYWAWLLRQAGADVRAFDRNVEAPPHWTEVERGGPEKAREHPERTLFLCWPPLAEGTGQGVGEGMSEECLAAFSEAGGRLVASIGEVGAGARTGSAGFRSRLEREFVLEREIELPRWPGYDDRLRIYRRSR